MEAGFGPLLTVAVIEWIRRTTSDLPERPLELAVGFFSLVEARSSSSSVVGREVGALTSPLASRWHSRIPNGKGLSNETNYGTKFRNTETSSESACKLWFCCEDGRSWDETLVGATGLRIEDRLNFSRPWLLTDPICRPRSRTYYPLVSRPQVHTLPGHISHRRAS